MTWNASVASSRDDPYRLRSDPGPREAEEREGEFGLAAGLGARAGHGVEERFLRAAEVPELVEHPAELDQETELHARVPRREAAGRFERPLEMDDRGLERERGRREVGGAPVGTRPRASRPVRGTTGGRARTSGPRSSAALPGRPRPSGGGPGGASR